MGLDEVRRYNTLQKGSIGCYADARTIDEIRRTFWYIFESDIPAGGGLPELDLFPIAGEFCLGRQVVLPVPVMHGTRPVLGYRFGSFAYLTDCSAIPDASWPLLEGLEFLVLDALRERPHPTHFTVTQALDAVARLRPARTWFTHIAHDLPHAETCRRLPEGVELAYDGLTVDVAV
jgi:phosphoribosyl 1,2-cyclic phosphate phosphodiesterase